MNHSESTGETGSEQTDYVNQVNSYRSELLKVYEKSNDLFEKQLSYISAGALGITFVLIEKVIKDFASAKLIGCIIACWILLALSLCVNLASHLYTSKTHYKTIQEIDAGQLNYKRANKRNKQISFINLLSLVSLFLGIFFFIVFTSYNVFNMKNLSLLNNHEHGPQINPPVPRPQPTEPSMPKPGTGVPAGPPPPPVR